MDLRRFLCCWFPLGLVGAVVVGAIATVVILRQWPEPVVTHLPLRSLGAVRPVATDEGVVAIERRLKQAAYARLVDAAELVRPQAAGVGASAEAWAWALLALAGDGYDHRTPNVFRPRLEHLIRDLTAIPAPSLAGRELALAQMAVAEHYAMTMDAALRPWVESGARTLLAGAAEERWSADESLAALTLMALVSTRVGGVDADAGLERLRTWWKTRDPGAPWDGEITSWRRTAWNGVFACFLRDVDALSACVLSLPPPTDRDPSLETWWNGLAAFQKSSSDYAAVTVPHAAWARSHAPIFRPWALPDRPATVAEIRDGAIAILHTQIYSRRSLVLPKQPPLAP